MNAKTLIAAFGPPVAILAAGLGLAAPNAAGAEGLRFSVGLLGAASQSPFGTEDPDGALGEEHQPRDR